MPFFVRILVEGVDRVSFYDQAKEAYGTKQLAVALEEGCWNIDNRPAAVEPGHVVSFADTDALNFFISRGRARLLCAGPGDVLALESEADANWLIGSSRAVAITTAEYGAL